MALSETGCNNTSALLATLTSLDYTFFFFCRFQKVYFHCESVLQVKMLSVSLTGCVDASGLELSSAAGVALQQADDGGVALRPFDELLQRQLS